MKKLFIFVVLCLFLTISFSTANAENTGQDQIASKSELDQKHPSTGTNPYPNRKPSQSEEDQGGERQGGDTFGTGTVIEEPLNGLTYNGTTVGYTDDYDANCGGGTSTSPDVVYTIYPNGADFIDIEICNSDYDTKLMLYDLSQNLIACSEDFCGVDGYKSQIINYPVVLNSPFYIVIDGWGGESGNYEMTVTASNPCAWSEPAGVTKYENETCGVRENDGCNMTIPTFTDVIHADTVVATCWADTGSRDTDYYQLILDQPETVYVSVSANNKLGFGLVESTNPGGGDCNDNTGFIDPYLSSTYPCDTTTLSVFLPAGTHWFWVSTPGYVGHQCTEPISGEPNTIDYWIAFDAGCCEGKGDVGIDDNSINFSDIFQMLDHVYTSSTSFPIDCFEEGDMNNDGIINTSDISFVLTRLFQAPVPCASPVTITPDLDVDIIVEVNGSIFGSANVGDTSELIIQILNPDDDIAGYSLGFEISIAGTYNFVTPYGNGLRDYIFWNLEDSTYLGFYGDRAKEDIDNVSPDTIMLMGNAFVGDIIPMGTLDNTYSLKFYIPDGGSSVDNGISVKPIFYPENGTWTVTDNSGTRGTPPKFLGQSVADELNPTVPPITFDIIGIEDLPKIVIDTVFETGTKSNHVTIPAETPVTIPIRFVNPLSVSITSFQNTFRIYSPDGATWSAPTPYWDPIFESLFDLPIEQHASLDGMGEDTIGFANVVLFSGGMYPGHDANGYYIDLFVAASEIGKTICIDSSLFTLSGQPWLWVDENSNQFVPYWDGPVCFEIVEGGCCDVRGDVTEDGSVLVDDLVLLVDFLFKGGTAPACPEVGDANDDGNILVDDLVLLVDFLFKGGQPPEPC